MTTPLAATINTSSATPAAALAAESPYSYTSSKNYCSTVLSKVLKGFQALRGSPAELWKAYTLKFLDSYSYFSFSLILTLFASNDFGYSDVAAGSIYGAYGAFVTMFGLFSGVIIDNLGVAKSLKIGFWLSFVARCGILFTTSSTILLLSIVLLSFGNCLGIPVLTTGIRRYTTTANRGFAFGLFYVIMNVAALLSGPVVDMCTIWYKADDDDASRDIKVWSLTSYRLIILTGVIANLVGCVVAQTVREIKVVAVDPSPGSPNTLLPTQSFRPVEGTVRDILKETLSSGNFWRFLVVCLLTMNVRMIFRHLDATLPKYMIREFGADTPKGLIYSINPAIVIILVPILTAATSHIDPLVMIHYGSYVSAASVFALVVSTSIPACIVFVVVLSIGEAIWSPRLYDYSMRMAQEGREGTYMALTSAPLFLAKLPVGFMSGYLLQHYCPADESDDDGTENVTMRHSKTMWLIIGLTTASSPICMTMFWNYISKTSNNVEDNAANSHSNYTELGVAAPKIALVDKEENGRIIT